MTLPITTILPLHSEEIKEGGDALEKYMTELILKLERQYEDVAQAINGDISGYLDSGSNKYVPIVEGKTTAGTGTYSNQAGLVLRQGLMVDVWFDVSWTAHTGTGNTEVSLPYEVADLQDSIFTGHIETRGLTFSGYIGGIARNNTFLFGLRDIVSGSSFANISILNGSARIVGHVRYLGKGI